MKTYLRAGLKKQMNSSITSNDIPTDDEKDDTAGVCRYVVEQTVLLL
jgi:hypothetical protein